MYQKNYKFRNVTFTIKSASIFTLNNQINHISQFYVQPEKNIFNQKISIEYIEDEYIFKEILNMLKDKIFKSYQSFTNQIHYEYVLDNLKYYVIDNKEYLCIKCSDEYYKLISDGKDTAIKWPFRIIREILVRKNEDNYGLFMHGTGFNLDDEGILVLGNSGSGKTTLTTKLFQTDSKINFLSNDRVFMYMDENPCMEYFPIPIVYSMGTVKSCEELTNYFIQTRILEKRSGKNFENSRYNDKVDIPLTDISKIFQNVELISESSIDKIILANISQNNRESITDLDNSQKDILLNQTCFTIFDWESLRLEWICKRTKGINEIIEAKIKTISKIIDSVPIVKLNYKYDTNGEKIRKLIRKI